MKNNVLNLKNKLALCRWLEGNAPKLATMNRHEVLDLATKELGIVITENNLTGAIEGAGLKIKFRRAPNTDVVSKSGMVKSGYTAAALRDLMMALDYRVPAYLDAVIAGKPLDVVDALYVKEQHRTSS